MNDFPDGFAIVAAMGQTRLRHVSRTLAEALAWRAEYEATGWTCSDPVAVRDADENIVPIYGHAKETSK